MVRLISSFNGSQLGQTSRVSRIRQMNKDVEITSGSGGIGSQRKEIILKFPKELQKHSKLPSRVDQPGIIHFMCWQEPGAKLESSMPSLGGMMSDTQSAYNTPYGRFIEIALKEQQQTLQPGERAYMLLPLSTDTT
ncbi:MAG: hypothetical protein SFU25_12215, partial [Candidatus Caenarcaniphilales bacterium]|nr:hypothetical protein [Candidatus Caenarcaniphilales bacterium]